MPVNVRLISYILLSLVTLITIAKLVGFRANEPNRPADYLDESAARNSSSHANAGNPNSLTKLLLSSEEERSPYAFVAFLAGNWQHQEFADDSEDEYFYATRVMGYQLMHNPDTRTNTSIPFVVLTTRAVSERKRARLHRDGARVIVVDDVPVPDWFEISNPFWSEVVTKLRVFQQTQFDKILLLDADVLPIRRLDGVFHDPATDLAAPIPERKREGDRIPLPSRYMFAGVTMGGSRDHDSSSQDKYYASIAQYGELDQVNAGFLLAAPSREIFEYYSAILAEENRFDAAQPEQNLLIEAHRVDGPMPWKKVRYDWAMNSPKDEDYDNGVHAVHEKLWRSGYQTDEEGTRRLGELWKTVRAEMEAYYRALDDPSPATRRVKVSGGSLS